MTRRPWRDLDADLFRFTTTELRDLHVGVMSAFEQASVLAPVLNIDGVHQALRSTGCDEPITEDQLAGALRSLVEWNLLEVSQDHTASYATPEEFERRNLQWSLSPKGQAAIAGVLAALEALRHTVSLQPAVLDAIGDALAEITAALDGPSTRESDASIHLRLAEIEGHLTGLVTSVRQFNGQLQRLASTAGEQADDDLFLEVKRRTVSYLEEFVEGVERPRRRIERQVRALAARTSAMFDRAVQGANLAPVAGDDPTPAWIAERSRRWDALVAWFAPTDGETPQVQALLGVARAAIIELLRVLERRWDERRRSASVANDLRTLAGWFRDAPSEAEAHRLFHAAFGLWPARHAHLRAIDADPRQPNRTFGETDPVEVAPSLRTTGDLTQRGRARPVADPTRYRAQQLRAQAAALLAHEQVRAALLTDTAIHLRDLPPLEPESFAELLALLARALDATPGEDGDREASSTDGQVEIVLGAADHRLAKLRSVDGVLTAPNFRVTIVLASRAPDPTLSPLVDSADNDDLHLASGA